MICDITGRPITSTNLVIAPAAEKSFSVLVDCKPNYKLKGTAAAGVTLSGRADPADAWSDITATPLDTEPFAPTRKQFYFKIGVDAATPPQNAVINIHGGP